MIGDLRDALALIVYSLPLHFVNIELNIIPFVAVAFLSDLVATEVRMFVWFQKHS